MLISVILALKHVLAFFRCFLLMFFLSLAIDSLVFMQILNHHNIYRTKPEMSLEKLQLLATAKVPGKYKERWLQWWNMSKDSRQAYNFPKSPCSTEDLRPWSTIAAFWAGVCSLVLTAPFIAWLVESSSFAF